MFGLALRVFGRILAKVPPTAVVTAGVSYYLYQKAMISMKKAKYPLVASIGMFALYRGYTTYTKRRRN